MEKIRNIREKLKLTQAELGERLGVAGNTVARWERGEVQPEHPRNARIGVVRAGNQNARCRNAPKHPQTRNRNPAKPRTNGKDAARGECLNAKKRLNTENEIFSHPQH